MRKYEITSLDLLTMPLWISIFLGFKLWTKKATFFHMYSIYYNLRGEGCIKYINLDHKITVILNGNSRKLKDHELRKKNFFFDEKLPVLCWHDYLNLSCLICSSFPDLNLKPKNYCGYICPVQKQTDTLLHTEFASFD